MKDLFIGSTAALYLSLVMTGPSTAHADTEALTVMSYNIRYNEPNDGINAWPNRRNNVADMIDAVYGVDIAGLQEALRGQVDDLDVRLPGYDWVGVGRDDGVNAGEFAPIFYRTDRFEVKSHDTQWLSETPTEPGSVGWDAMHPRIVTWAQFLDKQTGESFYFFNTHFDHRGSEARVESAKLLSGWATEAIDDGSPVIIAGDFNAGTGSTVYDTMVNTPHVVDTRAVSETAPQGASGTSGVGSNWDTTPTGSPIDYIFVHEDMRVLSHLHATDRYDGRFPSDHLPVVSEVVVPEPGTAVVVCVGSSLLLLRPRRRQSPTSRPSASLAR